MSYSDWHKQFERDRKVKVTWKIWRWKPGKGPVSALLEKIKQLREGKKS